MKTLEKQQAVALRKSGLSYREIQQSVAVSKSSLHHWLREITLTESQQARIHQKNLLVRREFVEYNEHKRRDILARKTATIRACAAEVGALTTRELKLIGAALYWAEGSKGAVEFVNSDSRMIALIMRWFRACCQVPDAKFRARVQLHDATRLTAAQRFWSQVTGIPTTQFTRPIQKVSPTSQGKRGNCLPYGTIQIRVSDIRVLTRILGWIDGLGLAPSSSQA